jgi:hypothetical protein
LANFHSHPCIFPSRHSLFSFSLPRTHSLLSSSQPRRQQQPARRSSMATNLPCGELLPPSSHAAERPLCRPPPGARPCKTFPPTGRAGALSSSPMATSSPSTHSPRRSTPARSSTPTFFLPVSLAAGAGALLSPIRRPAQRPPSRALPYPWPVNAQANALCSSMAAGRRRHLLPMALDTPMKLPWALEMPSSRRSPGPHLRLRGRRSSLAPLHRLDLRSHVDLPASRPRHARRNVAASSGHEIPSVLLALARSAQSLLRRQNSSVRPR